MKNLLLASLLTTSLFALAYTQSDISNANFLAERGIITKQTEETKYRLDNTITRAEVVAIALKIKGIQDPASYKCKKYFSDTVQNDWVCRAVEIAADNGIVSRNKKFRPQEKITRAEAFKMLFNISNAEIGERGLIKYGDTEIKDWQKALFTDIYASNIEIPGMKKIVSPFTLYFYPNRPATRAEVFEFSRNIINQNTKNFDNTEISFQLPLGWITKYEDFGHIKSYNFTNYNDACTVSYCPEGYRAFFLSVYKNDNRDNFFEKYQHDKKLYTEKEELDLGNNNKIEIFTLNKKSSTEDETWDMVLPVSSAFMEGEKYSYIFIALSGTPGSKESIEFMKQSLRTLQLK